MTQTVVILGAGYAGIGTAHKLLKDTRPRVDDLKVILVSPTTHMFWNIATVRGIIPNEIPEGDLFRKIEPGFARYSERNFEFVLGAATDIDTRTNNVSVKTDQGSRAIPYTHLVIATGSSYVSKVPFTTLGDHEHTLRTFRHVQSQVQMAKSIVIAGCGPTGVETAGELAGAFGGQKEITLIVGHDLPLSGLMPGPRKTALRELERLGVKIVPNTRVAGASADGSQTCVKLQDGTELKADLYLPLFGMKPNTAFVPKSLLDERGNVKLETSLRVEGTSNVWGVGDVGNLEGKLLIYAEKQALHLAKNLHAVLTENEAGVKELKPSTSAQLFVTIGKKSGTGQMGMVQLPAFVITMTKGKSFFIEKGAGLIEGTNIVRSSI